MAWERWPSQGLPLGPDFGDEEEGRNPSGHAVLIEEQRVKFDSVIGTIQTIKAQAQTIGGELEEHTVFLDTINGNLDGTEDRMQAGIRQSKQLYDKAVADRRYTLTIFILIVILLVLLVVLILT